MEEMMNRVVKSFITLRLQILRCVPGTRQGQGIGLVMVGLVRLMRWMVKVTVRRMRMNMRKARTRRMEKEKMRSLTRRTCTPWP